MEPHLPLHSGGELDRLRFDSPLQTLVVGAVMVATAACALLLTVGTVLYVVTALS